MGVFHNKMHSLRVLLLSGLTYKELPNEAERETAYPHSALSSAEALTNSFSQRYPHIPIGRPGHLLITVQRINLPVHSGKLKGSSIPSYMKRLWTPRIRNISQSDGR